MKQRPAPTQLDVARKAGVHQTTVSLVLRNHPSVPDATRERVLAAVRSLGYRKHPLVSALMSMRMRTRQVAAHTVLAFLTDFPTRDGWRISPTAVDMFNGAQARARELGYRLETFWLRDPALSTKRLVSIFHARNIHGVLLAPTPEPKGALEFDFGQFAVVGMGVSTAAPCMLSVAHDHFSGMQEALQRCLEAGRRRIGVMLTEPANEHVRDKWLAMASLHAANRRPRDRVAPCTPYRWDGDAIRAWLEKQRPDAIVGTFEHSPLDFLGGLGWRVPQQIAVASLNCHDLAGPLAGIYQSSTLIGSRAIELLVSQIERNQQGLLAERQFLHIAGRWHAGASMAA